MSIKVVQKLSMLEIANRTDPNGNFATIAELMSKENGILLDMPMIQANNRVIQRDTIRTSIPKGELRRLNKGVGKGVSQTEIKDVHISMIEKRSEVDADIVDNSPDPNATRMSEASAMIEGLSQSGADLLFYGNSKEDPDEFDGLSTITNKTCDTVIDAGGTGSDLTSIYIVQWDKNKVRGIYPQASKTAGVRHIPMQGLQELEDENGDKYLGYKDFFKWHFALSYIDPRCIARVANIESDGSTTNLDDAIITALNSMPKRGAGATIYCNKTPFNYLDILGKNKAQTSLVDVFGRPIQTFREGIPMKLCEAILDTEEAIS
jgi:hypothetical protein